jgi:hypothetical protein
MLLKPLGGDDSGDAGEIICNADTGPICSVEEGLHGGKGIVAQLENQDSAGFEVPGCLGDQVGVELVAFFAAEKGGVRFVVADFTGERKGFVATDVGRIADD